METESDYGADWLLEAAKAAWLNSLASSDLASIEWVTAAARQEFQGD